MNLPSHLADRLNLLEQLCEATPQGLWLVDEAGTTTTVNPAMCRMLGRDAQAMMGRNVFEMLQAEDALLLRQSFEQPAGTQRDNAGDSAGWLMTWTDVTAQRQTENALQMFGLAADTAPDMISLVDEMASPVSADGQQTFYAFGVDISDHLRAKRDVELLLGRSGLQTSPQV
jgi:PAS domain-containing protein